MAETKAAHTPGEWRVERIDYSKRLDVSFEILSGSRLVAQTIMREIATESDLIAIDEANVCLIAAAPEMYEALKAMVDCCTNSDGAVSPEPKDRGVWLDNMVAARSVLAKAEGKP